MSNKIKDILIEQFGNEVIVNLDEQSVPFTIEIQKEKIVEVCHFLYQNSNTYFDFLNCLTGIDNGKEKNTMEVIYHLTSIPFDFQIALKVTLKREKPSVQSISHIWRSANWHEREAYDLLGIFFEGHPDLRRILMPADWEGNPLKKDYEPPKTYRGIKIEY
jgi:NADH-quinone oxidoreductase subunit C